MRMLVARAEAKILTRLLPIKIVPINCPFCSCSLLTNLACVLPFCSSWCIRGREDPVRAVSVPEKNADKINNIKIAPIVINKVVSTIF